MSASYEIYLVTSERHWYVGSASGRRSTGATRFNAHMTGRGNARRLYEVVQELGREAFSFEIVERGVGDPIAAEQRWYELLMKSEQRECVNLKPPGGWDGAMRGRKHSDAQRALWSKARKGQPSAWKGQHHSAETRAVLSVLAKKQFQSPESRAAVSTAVRSWWEDSNYRSVQEALLAVNRISGPGKPCPANSVKVVCSCGRKMLPGAFSKHRKASGHEEVSRETVSA